jgi:hypothetical protein
MSNLFNYISYIILIIITFLIFFFLVEFIWFVSKPRTCSQKENFDLNCVSPKIIALSELLNTTSNSNKISSDTILKQIKQIKFNASEASNFNPILNSVFITSPDDKIEHLKQSIIQNYIINCKNLKYNSLSKINDIIYLKSSDTNIITILNKTDMPSNKIIDIAQYLQQNIHI